MGRGTSVIMEVAALDPPSSSSVDPPASFGWSSAILLARFLTWPRAVALLAYQQRYREQRTPNGNNRTRPPLLSNMYQSLSSVSRSLTRRGRENDLGWARTELAGTKTGLELASLTAAGQRYGPMAEDAMPTNAAPSQLPPRPLSNAQRAGGGGRGQGSAVSRSAHEWPLCPLCPALVLRIQARKEDTRYIGGSTKEVTFAGYGCNRWYLLALGPSKPSLSRAFVRAVCRPWWEAE